MGQTNFVICNDPNSPGSSCQIQVYVKVEVHEENMRGDVLVKQVGSKGNPNCLRKKKKSTRKKQRTVYTITVNRCYIWFSTDIAMANKE